MSSDTPSDTPRTDAIAARIANPDDGFDSIGFCRQLERELAASRSDLECQGQAYSKALDDLAAANKRLEEVKELLRVAKCPNCDCCGFIVHETGGCGPDGENDTRECVQEQCQWCYERAAIGCPQCTKGAP